MILGLVWVGSRAWFWWAPRFGLAELEPRLGLAELEPRLGLDWLLGWLLAKYIDIYMSIWLHYFEHQSFDARL